jgi:hypothetical protein
MAVDIACPLVEAVKYYINLDDHVDNAAILMIKMVCQNFEGYTRQEVKSALVCCLHNNGRK